MDRRCFYQIYVDGATVLDVFDLNNDVTHQLNVKEKIYGAFLNCLAVRGIKEFRDDGKQYIIKLSNDIEIKIARHSSFGKKWLQVSATNFEDAKAVFEELCKYVQEKLKILKEAKI